MVENLLLKTRKATEYIVYTMIVLMALIICYQVFSRFALNYTPVWIQPFSLLLMVWIGFIGIAVGVQDNTHIQINLFVSKMPVKVSRVIRLFQRMLALIFGLFMLFEGLKFSYSMKDSFISGLNTSSAILYVIVPISGLLIIVYMISEFMGKWKSQSEEKGGE